jgi:hypothetical protein
MPGFVAGVPRFRLGFRWFSFDDFYVKFLWKKDRKRYVFGCCHVRFKEKRPIDDSASAVCLVKIRKRRSEPIANGIIIRCSESLTNISRVPQCACRNVSPLCRTLFKQNYPINNTAPMVSLVEIRKTGDKSVPDSVIINGSKSRTKISWISERICRDVPGNDRTFLEEHCAMDDSLPMIRLVEVWKTRPKASAPA